MGRGARWLRGGTGLAVALALFAGQARAAEPTVVTLPKATHATSLAVAPDGTAWFIPERGTEWEGKSRSIIASISPAGIATEYQIAGFTQVGSLAVSPSGEIWIAGYRGEYTEKRLRVVARVSTSGAVLATYPVGRDGWAASLVADDEGAWFIRQPYGESGRRTSIEGISRVGAVTHIPTSGCEPKRIAAGPKGVRWVAETCPAANGSRRAYVVEASRDGKIARKRLGPEEFPTTLTVAPDGTVWFGASHKFPGAGYGYAEVGRITPAGGLAEWRLRDGSTYYAGAVGPEGRYWFQSSFGGFHARGLASIGVDGGVSRAICADPTCALEPTGLAVGPDGSFWYGLRGQNLNTGGGGSGIYYEQLIGNETGEVGHLEA